MYAFTLEHLHIQPGCSFLDVGSGCGLMTALGAYLAGPNGTSHGIDIIPKAVTMSRNSVQNIIAKGVRLGTVTFEVRNVFLPDKEHRKWDRIHVGAACSQKKKFYIYDLLKPGGILVMPVGDNMIMAQKDAYGMTRETKLLDVRYGDLVYPSDEELDLAENEMMLQVSIPETTFARDFSVLFNNSFLSDVSFLVGDNRIYAHKVVLVSRCPYYSCLYHSGLQETNTSEFHISDYSFDAFFEFMRFLYTDQCRVAKPQLAGELMCIAEFYRVERLKNLSESVLSNCLDIDNACVVLEIAHRFNAVQLKRLTFEFIINNYERIRTTSSFVDLHKDCVTEILTVAVQRIQTLPNTLH
eukprot:TRINITY_DN641_c0_g1_i3.p1 TRINITY_DN641_c0_g1~~TRINITY_DN641_c0_g1_i3.p1  ORF type:complete len:354 (+),score=35.29 TRINITY_DN641_c0_g1_i3:400-1461(+)